MRDRWTPPNVQWETDSPEVHGIDSSKLEALGQALAKKNTDAFLVVKDGKLVYEWYAPDEFANRKHSTAAMAKPVMASIALAVAASDGLIDLDDPVWKYIPAWQDDPVKSQITIRQLGSHSSGLDDVIFAPAESDPEWKHTYYQEREIRFPYAITKTPIIVEPGTQYTYSGVGYYVLAYALTSSLQETSNPNIHDLIENRIMKPLDIPKEAWLINYGENYEIDGMDLYAFGSGVSQTARSIAKIGQLVINRGEWNGQQVIGAGIIEQITSRDQSTVGRIDPMGSPPMGIGWFLNDDGFFDALPRDAIVGSGKGPNAILVIPSMNLVAVRLGGPLTDPAESSRGSGLNDLDEFLFTPLMAALDRQD